MLVLLSDNVISILAKGCGITLVSQQSSLELFYLCKVFDFGVALEQLSDKYNHPIKKGEKYMKGQYLQKEWQFLS